MWKLLGKCRARELVRTEGQRPYHALRGAKGAARKSVAPPSSTGTSTSASPERSIETYGLQLSKQLYPLAEPSDKLQELKGRSLEELEPDWLAYIKRS
jgi:hypothetical protein